MDENIYRHLAVFSEMEISRILQILTKQMHVILYEAHMKNQNYLNKKTDPLIIRIIKFIIRMIVLVGVSVFIYIGVRYIMSA